MGTSVPIIVLSGAGGGSPDFDVFRYGEDDTTSFEAIGYPDWRRCVADGYSAEVLIEDLAAQIVAKVPRGPIRIIGLSIGGHLGYAIGVRLQTMGREIDGLCAIDSFMFASSAPSKGWKGRAMKLGFELLRKRRAHEFSNFLRSRVWRSFARFTVGRVPGLLRKPWFQSIASPPFDPIFENELSVRLLIHTFAPWMASVQREPVALKVPATLLRTALTATDDVAWLRRCPNIKILEIPGHHHSLFDPENIGSLREAFLAGTSDWRGGSVADVIGDIEGRARALNLGSQTRADANELADGRTAPSPVTEFRQ
jgi:thioesterase domain-containing protein